MMQTRFNSMRAWTTDIFPGLALCVVLSGLAMLAGRLQLAIFGSVPIDELVCAILIGAALRTVWSPSLIWAPGVRFTGKGLLEGGVALMGAALSLRMLLNVEHGLLLGIAVVVALSTALGYGMARVIGLTPKLAMLVACGNSICGNSAIAAISPIIDADPADTISAIAMTAVLGVLAVILMPVLPHLFGLSQQQYGVYAGLTVYSVPQVIAATAPIGLLSIQLGTFTKLLRILMLAPVAIAVSLIFRTGETTGKSRALRVPVPWFIFAFFALMLVRAAGLVPDAALPPMALVSQVLTLLAMAALGLGVDLRQLLQSGPRVGAAALASLVILLGLSAVLLHLTAV
jgi:uncharacterized integral membrane protein (TIGR00698 family)